MTTRLTVELRERTAALPGGNARVDRAAGIVHDVKVLGLESRNGRRYLPEATRDAVRLYEGKPVYFDHPEGKSNARKLSDRFGKLSGVYRKPDGSIWAKELRFNPSHPLAESFVWHAENDPDGIGLSHNADGSGYRDKDGNVVIDRIKEVYSVDLVDGPATTRGLFEQDTCTVPTRRIVEGEMDQLTDPAGTDPAIPADPAPTPDASGGEDHKTHLVNAITALADGLRGGAVTVEDAKSQIQSLLKMIGGGEGETPAPAGDLTESDDGDGDEKKEKELPDDLKDDEKKVMESLRRTRAGRWAIRKLDAVRVREQLDRRVRMAVEAKLPVIALTEQFRADLADAKDDAHAKRMIEDRRRVVGLGGPKSAPAVTEKPKTARELAETFWTE